VAAEIISKKDSFPYITTCYGKKNLIKAIFNPIFHAVFRSATQGQRRLHEQLGLAKSDMGQFTMRGAAGQVSGDPHGQFIHLATKGKFHVRF
jgi:hypothetical protein